MMKRILFIIVLIAGAAVIVNGQTTPTGDPKDFKVKTCLHSVSYMGVWRGQATLTVDEFLLKARELGFDGVMLAAQNHHDIALHHDAMKWLLDEVNLPNVKAAFDCWSPTLEGLSPEEIKEAVHIMKSYIVHTTTADYKELPRFRYELNNTNYVQLLSQMRAVPIGEGFLDYITFIGTLKEIGYQGYIAYEMCEVLDGGGSVENLDRCAKNFWNM